MSTQPSKKGRDRYGHVPSRPENNTTALVEHKSAKTRTREQGDVKRKGADLMVAPLKLNVRLPRVRVCSVEPLRGLVKPRNKLREFGSDDLCRGRLIEVAAGGLAECTHDLAHLLLGRGAQLGDDLLDQSLELLARNLCGQQALQRS